MSKPILVHFTAIWCKPCQAMAPKIDSLVSQFADKMDYEKVDVDQFPEKIQQYGIRSVPTMILIKGHEENRLVGAKALGSLEEILKNL